MKKPILLFTLLLLFVPCLAQDLANTLIENTIKKGVVILRQDYQMLNEDDEPIQLKMGIGCYGRTYTLGVRVNEEEYLVVKDFVTPWANESIVISEKRHPGVSYTGFKQLNTLDFEQIDCDVESAEEIISNHIYAISGSEIEGFDIDENAGKKKGYAVWVKSANAFDQTHEPTDFKMDISPFNITTREGTFVYDISKQPSGNVIGGVFLVPSSSNIGNISIKVNGMFEKRGGVWKFISLGIDEMDE